jgi:hypothetical protein
MIAPVSSQIPCKQGIFQGILKIRPLEFLLTGKKRLRRRDFLQNSLWQQSGKIFRRTGILAGKQGKSGQHQTATGNSSSAAVTPCWPFKEDVDPVRHRGQGYEFEVARCVKLHSRAGKSLNEMIGLKRRNDIQLAN